MDPDRSAATSNLRRWSTLISPTTISLPLSLSDVTHRLSANTSHFHLNYINISLILLFISLIFHPFAVILFLLTASAWYYYYFYYLINREDNPLVILHRTIDDRTILAVLGVVTVLALVLGNVWLNLFVSVVVSCFVVFVLAVVRVPVDDSPYGSLLDNNNSPLGAYSHV